MERNEENCGHPHEIQYCSTCHDFHCVDTQTNDIIDFSFEHYSCENCNMWEPKKEE